ncbi:diguanylate cyclase [Fontimonas sp. SYSU GA230001]|uniref:diguanylate cyclase n=1 Tax=Fontimonas sp. SYSU GA230001 TaxID=3142450 RepID=UPI0032B4FE24
MNQRRFRHVVHAITALTVWLLLSLLATYLVSLQRTADRVAQRDQTLLHAAALRARIESELSATAYLAQGLVAYINARGPLDPASVQRALARLYQSGRHLRSIGIAPDNRIAFIYPQIGNEQAIGLRYEDQPDQWPAVRRAMETGSAVLAGPVDLVQGGQALINRSPVFVDGDRYWGVVSVSIDLPAFLRAVGLGDVESGVQIALRGRDGLGARGDLIAGDATVFDDSPIRMVLAIPGGSWELAARPSAGWDRRPIHSLLLPYVAYGGAFVLAALLWLALNERNKVLAARAEMQQLVEQLSAANHELEHLSETDPLTGVPNRRGLEEVLTLEWRRCKRQHEPLTLLMIDIDQFKAYNDARGHLQGDQCLRQVAATLKATASRAGEFVARIGGEEFMMVLPGTAAGQGILQAERVRAAVEHARLEHGSSPVSPFVTVSIGVATRAPHSSVTLEALREAADSALYEAKHQGRNRVCVAPDHGGAALAQVSNSTT